MKRIAVLVISILLLAGCEAPDTNDVGAVPAVTLAPSATAAAAWLPATSSPTASMPQATEPPVAGSPLTEDDLWINGVRLEDSPDVAIDAFSFAPYNTRITTSPLLSFARYYRVSGARRAATTVSFDANRRVCFINNSEPGATTLRGVSLGTAYDVVTALYGEPVKTSLWEPSWPDGEYGNTLRHSYYACSEGVLVLTFSYHEPSVVTEITVYRKHEYQLVNQWTRTLRLSEDDDEPRERVIRVYLPQYEDWSNQYNFEPAIMSIEQDGEELLRGPVFAEYDGYPDDLCFMEAPVTMDFDGDGQAELAAYCQGYLTAMRTEDLAEVSTVKVWQLIDAYAKEIFGDALTGTHSYKFVSTHFDYVSLQGMLLYDMVLYDSNIYPSYPLGGQEGILGFATVGIAIKDGKWDVINYMYYPTEGR